MIPNPVTVSVYQEAGLSEPLLVEKRWGTEHIFINGEGTSTRHETGYCMKEIRIKQDHETSLHFHLHKHETIYVVDGTLVIDWNDGTGGSGATALGRGSAFVIPPGFQHKLRAPYNDVTLLEASTIDDPNDSIRVSF